VPAPTPDPEPDDVADPRARRAEDLIMSGQFSEALTLGEEISATAADPESRAQGHYVAGLAMTMLAEQSNDALLADRAIAYFDQAEAAGWQAPPEDQVGFLAQKAYANFLAGALRGDFVKLSEAERLSREALQLGPGNLRATMTLGLTVAKKGVFSQRYDQVREGVSLLRLSQAGYAERGDAATAESIENMIYHICARGTC
jgi:hypothetical protein